MQIGRLHSEPDIYTQEGRSHWQEKYAPTDLAFFQTLQGHRLVLLTILAPETACGKEMRHSLLNLAKRVIRYCSDHGIALRGYTEVEALPNGIVRPHIHAVLALPTHQEKQMRQHLVQSYPAPYAIKFVPIHDLRLEIFRYMLKGQSTYRDAQGNYTHQKLAMPHLRLLAELAQPIRIAIGQAVESQMRIMQTEINDVITLRKRQIIGAMLVDYLSVVESPVSPIHISKQGLIRRQHDARAPP